MRKNNKIIKKFIQPEEINQIGHFNCWRLIFDNIKLINDSVNSIKESQLLAKL